VNETDLGKYVAKLWSNYERGLILLSEFNDEVIILVNEYYVANKVAI
jgi:hypothetical protein